MNKYENDPDQKPSISLDQLEQLAIRNIDEIYSLYIQGDEDYKEHINQLNQLRLLHSGLEQLLNNVPQAELIAFLSKRILKSIHYSLSLEFKDERGLNLFIDTSEYKEQSMFIIEKLCLISVIRSFPEELKKLLANVINDLLSAQYIFFYDESNKDIELLKDKLNLLKSQLIRDIFDNSVDFLDKPLQIKNLFKINGKGLKDLKTHIAMFFIITKNNLEEGIRNQVRDSMMDFYMQFRNEIAELKGFSPEHISQGIGNYKIIAFIESLAKNEDNLDLINFILSTMNSKLLSDFFNKLLRDKDTKLFEEAVTINTYGDFDSYKLALGYMKRNSSKLIGDTRHEIKNLINTNIDVSEIIVSKISVTYLERSANSIGIDFDNYKHLGQIFSNIVLEIYFGDSDNLESEKTRLFNFLYELTTCFYHRPNTEWITSYMKNLNDKLMDSINRYSNDLQQFSDKRKELSKAKSLEKNSSKKQLYENQITELKEISSKLERIIDSLNKKLLNQSNPDDIYFVIQMLILKTLFENNTSVEDILAILDSMSDAGANHHMHFLFEYSDIINASVN